MQFGCKILKASKIHVKSCFKFNIMSNLFKLESYLEQNARWPISGKHILAYYDDESIIVYQAFNKKIADAAVSSQNFNTEECAKSGYSYTRMTWIKTNFLWMMYRSGWATKPNQERILAIRIKRSGFEEILSNAVVANHAESIENQNTTASNCSRSDKVRLQWDPDHTPCGTKVSTGRRAIQLGLRNEILKMFCDKFILNIYDITDYVVEQREKFIETKNYDQLQLPSEHIYKIENDEIVKNIQLSTQ